MCKELYHGSYLRISEPEFIVGRFTKDFGNGFYLTEIKQQAIQWAKRKTPSIINTYSLDISDNLDVKIFKEIDEEWLDFIMNCREGKPHSYDIVEGAVADDTIWTYLNDYMRGAIPKKVMLEIAKFNKPSHQICLCSSRALRCLKFIKSEEV